METNTLQPNTEVRDVLNNLVSSIVNPAIISHGNSLSSGSKMIIDPPKINFNTHPAAIPNSTLYSNDNTNKHNHTIGSLVQTKKKRGRPRKNAINKSEKPIMPTVKAPFSNKGSTLQNTMNVPQLNNHIFVSQNGYQTFPYLPVQNSANTLTATNNYIPHLNNMRGVHFIDEGSNVRRLGNIPYNTPLNEANKSKVQPKKWGIPQKIPDVSSDKSLDTKRTAPVRLDTWYPSSVINVTDLITSPGLKTRKEIELRKANDIVYGQTQLEEKSKQALNMKNGDKNKKLHQAKKSGVGNPKIDSFFIHQDPPKKKVGRPRKQPSKIQKDIPEEKANQTIKFENALREQNVISASISVENNSNVSKTDPPKRKVGRPRKNPPIKQNSASEVAAEAVNLSKRKVGRPRKHPLKTQHKITGTIDQIKADTEENTPERGEYPLKGKINMKKQSPKKRVGRPRKRTLEVPNDTLKRRVGRPRKST